MKKLYPILIAFVLFAGCKSAGKSYQKGDYKNAIEIGLKKLQKDPNDQETMEIVMNAYKYAVMQHENQIRSLSNSKNDNRFSNIYNQYLQLQALYHLVQSSPVAASGIKAQDYSSYVETYREKAIEVHTDRAAYYISLGRKNDYRLAYYEINNALKFSNSYELRKKRDSLYDAALTKVVFIPLQYYGGYQYNNSYQIQNFQNEILRTLSQNRNNEFVRYYSEWEARSQQIEPDQLMELNLSRVMLGRPSDRRSTREVSKEVVIKEIVYKPDSVVKQYGTVRAKITTTKRTLLSDADLVITLRDRSGRIVWNDRFTGQHQWQSEFSTFTGDERALSENDKQLVNNNNDNYIPAEEEVMEALLRQIQIDLASRLRSYYSRY
jgi:hypothetical protein